jgi:hypothetical protein
MSIKAIQQARDSGRLLSARLVSIVLFLAASFAIFFDWRTLMD